MRRRLAFGLDLAFGLTAFMLSSGGVFTAGPGVTPLSPEQEHALKPKDAFKECDTCPEMVVVPAGSFVMGSPDSEKDRSSDEGPQHRVTFAKQFAVGKLEVTVDQFAAFVKDTGHEVGSCYTIENGKLVERSGWSFRNPGFSQAGSHPAACLNWHEAKAYVAWLAKKTGKPYRLLTEAEWEYAARGGTTTRYHFGDNENALCGHGNGADQTAKESVPGAEDWTVVSCSDGYGYTAPAGSFAANAFGLYDMHGNVWEWTEDCWNDSHGGAPADGSVRTSGDCSRRVVRGGSWSDDNLRAALRVRNSSDFRFNFLGFRVARTLTP